MRRNNLLKPNAVNKCSTTIERALLETPLPAYFSSMKHPSSALGIFQSIFFTALGFNKLFLRTHPGNASARKLAENCGFEIEGIIRKDYKTSKGELVDLVYYGKLSIDLT